MQKQCVRIYSQTYFSCKFAITLQSCINVHIGANNSISLCWFSTCLVPSDLNYPYNRVSKFVNFNISWFRSFVITIITHFITVVLTLCVGSDNGMMRCDCRKLPPLSCCCTDHSQLSQAVFFINPLTTELNPNCKSQLTEFFCGGI